MSHKVRETNNLYRGLAVEKRKKRKQYPRALNYDKPREGYDRWTCHVRIELLQKFKEVAKSERKTLIVALQEALENWTNFETHNEK